MHKIGRRGEGFAAFLNVLKQIIMKTVFIHPRTFSLTLEAFLKVHKNIAHLVDLKQKWAIENNTEEIKEVENDNTATLTEQAKESEHSTDSGGSDSADIGNDGSTTESAAIERPERRGRRNKATLRSEDSTAKEEEGATL